MKRLLLLLASIFFCLLLSTSIVNADWPMVAHDPQRTSYASEDALPIGGQRLLWYKEIPEYIPSKAHIITVERTGGNSMLYVATAGGVYALDPDTGNEIWFYQTSMPVGNSPTVVSDVMYVPVMDKTIHAVNAITGELIWQTDRAGAGFVTNPLVAANKVYAGNRDG